MNKLIYTILSVLLITACSSMQKEYLVKFCEGEYDEIGAPCGYMDSKGKTIIPPGKYYYCYTNTIRDFGIVMKNESGKIIGIDREENELFQIYKYDNGPDYIKDGMFRIIVNGKLGFANEKGKIIIPPKYFHASPFKNGFAQVWSAEYNGCENPWHPSNSFKIDKRGNRIEK